MKISYLGNILSALFLVFVTSVISCSGRSGKNQKPGDSEVSVSGSELSVKLMKMTAPESDEETKLREPVVVKLESEKGQQSPDSVRIYFDGQVVAVLFSAPWECTIPSSLTGMTGRKAVKASTYFNKKIQTITHFVIIYSDVTPKKQSYRVVKMYPHDTEAFTQGLLYDNGVLYEGTGQQAGSGLREVELATGKVVRQHNLEASLFGEGITIYRDKIYEVTWQNKVGFIYDKKDFSLINKVYYQTEGWGLTTLDDRIVMSDGSNILYFYDPETFTVVSRLEVYDNEKKVDQLNELEYINGEIWANIWQTDLIARIDPLSGKVNSYIDLSQLFPLPKRSETGADVLNGIAYDAVGKRIFVTGKKWPKLYEITITE